MELREQPELGARIRDLRTVAAWDQAALADAIGLRQPDVSKIERGERSVSATELFRIADALGVSANDILVPAAERELNVAFRRDGSSGVGAQSAVELVEQLARELDHLRALAP